MRLDQRLLVLGVLAVFIAGACNMTAANQSDAEATLAALAVQASVDASIQLTGAAGDSGGGSSAGDSAAPTATEGPSSTPEPSLTPTSSVPTISVSVDTNCRTGPSPVYDYTGALLVGETTNVVGRLSNNQWVVVKNPDGGPDCWLWMQYATVTGDLSALPVMTPPPTPTPTYTPTPQVWFHGNWNVLLKNANYTMSVTQSGTSISGYINAGLAELTFTGTASGAEYKYVSGSWSGTNGASGVFEWQLLSSGNQFTGNITRLIPGPSENTNMCGYRSGASAPSPCAGP